MENYQPTPFKGRRNGEASSLLEGGQFVASSHALPVGHSLNLPHYFNAALDMVLALTKAEAGAIFLFDEESKQLVLQASRGGSEKFKEQISQIEPEMSQAKVDLKEDKFFITVPLKFSTKTVGAISLVSRDIGSAVPGSGRLYSAIGEQIALVAEASRVIEKTELNLLRLIHLQTVNQQVNSTLNLDEVLDSICQSTVRALGYKMAWIGLIDGDSYEVVPVAQSGFEDEQLSTIKVRYDDSPLGNGPTGLAIKTKQPVIQENIDTDPKYALWKEEALKRGYRCLAAFPLITDKKVIGAINVYSDKEKGFKEDDVTILKALADQSAGAIEKARLHQQIHHTYLETVQALAAAIEAKDPYAIGHAERVSLYATTIARELKLSTNQVEGIRVTGILHDIGKIAISERILLKKAKLTPEESEAIKTHPVVGAEILKPVPFPWEVATTVYHHHENYDGTGYPDRLAMEAIPLGARILRIADTFEALTTERAYRKAMPLSEALTEALRLGGTALDPMLLKAFVAAVGKHVLS